MACTRWFQREHRLARRLFDQYERIQQTAARRKGLLFLRLREKLEARALVIREVLEATERHSGPGALGESAEKVLDKLQRLGEILDEIALVGPSERQFDSKIRLLREYLDVEIQNDEALLILQAEKHLGRKRVRELAARGS